MGDAAQPNPVKQTGPATFDVPAWLGELTGVRDWQVRRRFTRRKVEFVTDYASPDGVIAKITMRAVTTASHASWELRADFGQSRAGVVIPARIRIKW
jgi:hypothetical protein